MNNFYLLGVFVWNGACSAPSCTREITLHSFDGGDVNIKIRGDFSHESEYASIRINGEFVTDCAGGWTDCVPEYHDCGTFRFDPGETVTLWIQSSANVNSCPGASMEVEATFSGNTFNILFNHKNSTNISFFHFHILFFY